jgi:hypothetical protein
MGRTMWVLQCSAVHYLRTRDLLIHEYRERPLWGLPKTIPAKIWVMSEYRLSLRKQGRL